VADDRCAVALRLLRADRRDDIREGFVASPAA
jgi:hypothetical protein